MFGLPTLAETALLLTLAAGGECTVLDAPTISINPTTTEIEYDFNQTAETLTKVKTDTVSPYGLGVDTITRGLRHDRPALSYEIQFGTSQNAGADRVCMWFKDVSVDIKLRPKIYIAQENARGQCGEFILKHERKHVAADRRVMNNFAQRLGVKIQEAVNQMGAVGPFSSANTELVKEQMAARIQRVIDEEKIVMHAEMAEKQGAIDTLQEYEEGDTICSRHIYD